MNIVIAGAGKVGYFLAKELMEENDVTLIDSNEKTIQNIDETLDVLSICGDVENPHTYRGIKENIDLFIAVTDSDEVNLLSSLIIENIASINKKIIRLKNDFFKSNKIRERLNISNIITPSKDVANTFNYLVDFPHANNIKAFDCTKALLLSIRVHEEFEPILASSLKKDLDNKILVAGIERDNKFFIPDETAMIMPNDLIYFFAFPSKINSIKINTVDKYFKQEVKNCIVYGANQVGIDIAKVLAKKGLNIKLIDKTLDGCKLANTVLKNSVEVIKSNYNLDFILENYGLNTNMFIAATTDDEFNITKCIEANYRGVEKVIGIHNNRQYASLMRRLGIEVIRGEKMSAYYNILEKIISTSTISKRIFCGGEGQIYLQKVTSTSNGKRLEISKKIYEKGSFFIQRDKKFFSFKSIEFFEVGDIIICFLLVKNAKPITNWFKQNVDE